MSIKDLLERQFNLMYFLNMSISDIEQCDVSELSWIYSRLCKQKNDEQEAIEQSYKK